MQTRLFWHAKLQERPEDWRISAAPQIFPAKPHQPGWQQIFLRLFRQVYSIHGKILVKLSQNIPAQPAGETTWIKPKPL
jgi:hypothetical protein